MKHVTAVLVALSMVAATLPRSAAAQAASGADTLPTVTLPAELDRVLRDYERSWRARDPKGLASLFTTDGFVLSGGRPPAPILLLRRAPRGALDDRGRHGQSQHAAPPPPAGGQPAVTTGRAHALVRSIGG